MSEYINNASQREEKLKEVIRQLHAGQSVEGLQQQFNELLQGASSQEIVHIEQTLIAEGLPIEQVQFLCDIHVALFKEALDQQLPPEMQPGHPIYTFRAENEFAEIQLHAMNEMIVELQRAPSENTRHKLLQALQKLQLFDLHYQRKENLLFPVLEKYDFSGPSSVMWGVHDEIRALWKKLETILKEKDLSVKTIAAEYYDLQHKIREMFYKEDRILFPTALEKLSLSDWELIYRGEPEIGFAFVTRGSDWTPADTSKFDLPQYEENGTEKREEMEMVELTLKVGKLTALQVDLLLQNLPVDVTYVDENDQVAFYSQSRERIFARTPAVIGRKVQMCHPPASVDKVQKILDDFRAGVREEAAFWIQMNGKFIHIRYFAVHDDQGIYRGTIEVTQDITEIRALEGEKRLLDD